METTKTVCLLKDPSYRRGFGLRGLGGEGGGIGVEYTAQFAQSQPPCWTLAQWAARYRLGDPAVSTITETAPGVFDMRCPTNHFVCDTHTKTLLFDSTTTNNYTHPRRPNEGWQHLLIETNFTDLHAPDEFTHIQDLKSLCISGKVQLQKFEDHLGADFVYDLHAAQFLLYLTVHNANPASEGFGEMIWFGVNFFDNRREWTEYSADFDVGTQALMVGIGNRPVYPGGKSFFDPEGRIIAGPDTPEYAFSIDALPMIRGAYDTARAEGYFCRTQPEDLYVTGMNLGWELPGTYNAAMQLRDFDITVTL